MKYVLVAILILIIVYFVISLITSHRKRLNLIHYVIMLLLEDDIWQKHKQQLKDWVNTQEGLRNRSELLQRSYYPIQTAADELRQHSFTIAFKRLWDVKEGTGK